jgi:hypothetical protein
MCVWVYVASGYSRHFDISDFVSGIWKHTYFDIYGTTKIIYVFSPVISNQPISGSTSRLPKKGFRKGHPIYG